MDFPNYVEPILSRVFELASPVVRKAVLKNTSYCKDFSARGALRQDKEVSNRQSLLHQRIVQTVVRKAAVAFLLPFLKPLEGEEAGPLRVTQQWLKLCRKAQKAGALPRGLYDAVEGGVPSTVLCSPERETLTAPDVAEAIHKLLDRYGRQAITALVAAAWIETVCLATDLRRLRMEDPESLQSVKELSPAEIFSVFFMTIARQPELRARFDEVGLFPSEFKDPEVLKELGLMTEDEIVSLFGDSEGAEAPAESDAAAPQRPDPDADEGPTEEKETALTGATVSAAPDRIGDASEALKETPAVPAARTGAAPSVSSSAAEQPAASPVGPDPWADDGAHIPTVFDAPVLETEPVPGRPAGCTRSLVYAMMTGGSFWNLYFVANLDDAGGVLPLSEEEIARRFPKFGAVNIRFPSNARASLAPGHFYVFDWSDADLEVNRDIDGSPREDYCYRVEGPKVQKEGRLFPASRLAFYPVVRPADAEAGDVFDIDWERTLAVRAGEAAVLSGARPLTGSSVLLAVGDKLVGPSTLKENAQHRPYLSFTSEVIRSGGLVAGYELPSGKAAKSVFLEVEQFRPDTFGYVPVTVARVPELDRKLFDVRSDEALLREACEATAKTPMEREVFSRLATLGEAAKNPFGGDPAVADARAKRLQRMLAGFRRSDDWVENAGQLFTELFDRLSESKSAKRSVDALVERLMKEPQLPRKLESYGEVAERIEKLRTEAKFIEAENGRKTDEAKTKLARLDREIAAKEREIEAKKLEKAAVEKSLLADVQEEVEALERRRALLEGEVDRAGERLREAFADAGRYAFDGVVAAKFTEAAAAWEDEERKRNFDERARAIAALPLCPKEGNALKRHLLDSVAEYRSYYPANDVLNLFLLLTQNFLTILSGPPGAGKTSICGILAHAMGLTTLHAQPDLQEKTDLWDDLHEADRYLPVSVERGWTSKRDFIGYYNPLTKTFESLDARRYEAFAELNAEKRAECESVPYLMLLDEANLSPMEYYFADFMNICDERTDLSFISLGDKMRYAIPDTLRFVATINDDFTTENLSPRLLDRAAVATLPEADPAYLTSAGEKRLDLDAPRPVVSWPAMQALFGARRDLDADGMKAKAAFDDLCTHFAELNGHRTPVSPRTRISSLAYVSAAVKVFEKSDRPAWVEALDYVCAQRLLPRINGNGPRFRERLEDLRRLLVRYDLQRSTKLLDNLLARGEMEMDFYRFCG